MPREEFLKLALPKISAIFFFHISEPQFSLRETKERWAGCPPLQHLGALIFFFYICLDIKGC